MSAEESEDYYEVRLFFRPAGRYRGEPGVEQLIFDKTGELRVRQMLDEPSEQDETSSPARQVDEATVDAARPDGLSSGLKYSSEGRHQEAIGQFTVAIQQDPKCVDVYWFRGIDYRKLDQHLRAIEDFDEAIRLAPGMVAQYSTRGNSHRRRGHYQRAIQDFDEAIRLNPELGFLHDAWAFTLVLWENEQKRPCP